MAARAVSMVSWTSVPGLGITTNRSTPSSANAEAVSAVSRPRGVTEISSRPSDSARLDAIGRLGQAGQRRRRVLGLLGEPVPTLGTGDRSAIRRRRVPADDDRDRLLHGPRVGVDTAEVGEASVELRVLVVPERCHGGQVLVSDGATLVVVGADRPELGLQVADADTDVTRPPLSTSRLATCLARTTGLRCGMITMPVARRTVDVLAAAHASASSGSSAASCGAIGDGGTCGSGSTTCSPAQTDSKPARSAAAAVSASPAGWAHAPMLMLNRPSCMPEVCTPGQRCTLATWTTSWWTRTSPSPSPSCSGASRARPAPAASTSTPPTRASSCRGTSWPHRC